MSFHVSDPSELIEATFRRIETERMAGMSMLNPALAVAAVGFARHGDNGNEWRGVLLTPWGISLMLLPAAAGWPPPGSHERVFRQYASGTLAFLGNHEDGLGDYLTCPLIHDMQQFADQETALLTARACLIALDLPPPQAAVAEPPVAASRRKFLGMGS